VYGVRITTTHCVIAQKSTFPQKSEFLIAEIKSEFLMSVHCMLFFVFKCESLQSCVQYLYCFSIIFVCVLFNLLLVLGLHVPLSVVNPEAQNGVCCNEVRGLIEE
jgi:hypothetical protein